MVSSAAYGELPSSSIIVVDHYDRQQQLQKYTGNYHRRRSSSSTIVVDHRRRSSSSIIMTDNNSYRNNSPDKGENFTDRSWRFHPARPTLGFVNWGLSWWDSAPHCHSSNWRNIRSTKVMMSRGSYAIFRRFGSLTYKFERLSIYTLILEIWLVVKTPRPGVLVFL